jgi:hypothetical protein
MPISMLSCIGGLSALNWRFEMILLLCGLIALALIGFTLLYVELKTRDSAILLVFGGGISLTAAAAGLIIYCLMVVDYVGAEYKKDVINREYGTSYTQKEVFFASSVIDTVRELDRKRIEINGDIMKK